MIWILLPIVAVALAYQLLSLAASLIFLRTRELPGRNAGRPGVSILKPVHGLDPNFRNAILSHARQDYPTFEILFGVSDPADPAIGEVERLIAEFPALSIRLIRCAPLVPNAKVGVLMELAALAQHPVWLVNDSDIIVPPGYLAQVTAPLSNPEIGLVTCLYNATSQRWPGRFEALGIATDFVPGVLVAPFFGVKEFGLGSTLVFRAADLERAGGFAAIGSFLADDYQLGRSLHQLGLRCHLSTTVVETQLAGASWSEIWRHQVRWARTIRVSRRDGYIGLPATHASLWALAAALCGFWWMAAILLIVRLTAAFVAGSLVVGNRDTSRYLLLVPLRDLWGSAVWLAGLGGRSVEWRGQRLRLDRGGRIVAAPEPGGSF